MSNTTKDSPALGLIIAVHRWQHTNAETVRRAWNTIVKRWGEPQIEIVNGAIAITVEHSLDDGGVYFSDWINNENLPGWEAYSDSTAIPMSPRKLTI